MAVLLIVSEQDIASTIQGDAVLARGGWNELETAEDGRVWKHEKKDVCLWWFAKGFLMEDDLDSRFSSATNIDVDEVIFLSRHFAASGRPSLTLHVIGVPGELPHGERAGHGGIKGDVVLPNSRFASWYRLMCEAAHRHSLVPEFELTIETTHHGPCLSSPTMFIEIGSSETHWNRRDAAEAWADVIEIGLGLDGGEGVGEWSALTTQEKCDSKVMIGIGGGHYAPRHTDVLRKTDCWAGHQIAGYALEMEKPDDEDWDPDTGIFPDGAWNHSIRVCVESTRQAFPDGIVTAHLDRKSFKGWQRRVIKRLLLELNVPVGRTIDFE
ncbi:MAG: D-aminoacyl-tRNA deacylase [Candidatus Thermoplasmatota archaeon]|nr:D-aminoacyl-tRNA deacylase [Candidatus Thermoplasmatota archaeon]